MLPAMSRVQLLASRALWLRRERYRYRKWRWYQRKSRRPQAQRDELRKKWFRLWTEAHAQRMLREQQLRAPQAPDPARGIDVSNHQAAVNFRAVRAAGYRFAYVKATEGEGFVDTLLPAHVAAARAAGVKVGAYHFLRPRPGRTGGAEADDFVRQLRAVAPLDLRPACDVEVTSLSPAATEIYVEQFLDAVQAATGDRPLIYTYPYFIHPWRSAHEAGLWIADYRGRKAPEIPGPWPRWLIWQYSSSGQVPGVGGHCDVNVCPDLRKVVVR